MSAGLASACAGLQPALLREASDWRLISLLFECPVSGWLEEVSALGDDSGDRLLLDAARAAASATEGQYHSIFGPGGPVPPREVSYYDGIQLGQLMSELAAHYNAFAFCPRSREVPDHVSVETGFVGYLRLKEAYAAGQGDAEHASIAAKTAASFIDIHLSRLAGPLADRLARSGVEHLALASRALLERTGPPRRLKEKSVFDILSSPAVEDPVFDCGDG